MNQPAVGMPKATRLAKWSLAMKSHSHPANQTLRSVASSSSPSHFLFSLPCHSVYCKIPGSMMPCEMQFSLGECSIATFL